ncbi:MAG TPA: HDIG domain-containing protein [Anaerolineales bacterium]|nr:HDIG domain-containing protein [Anaerolineales bacterium]
MASEPRPRTPLPLRTLRAFIVIAVVLVAYAALVLPLSLRAPALPLQAGDVAPRDMQAPRNLQFVSQVRTDEARDAAEKAVLPVYTAPDPGTARKQIDQLNAVLQDISAVRADTVSTIDQKEATLIARTDLGLPAQSISQILEMPDARWNAVQQESLRVLEQVMRTPVRADNLDFVKNDIASQVSLTLNEQEALTVTQLVSSHVVPNSQYSQDLTTGAQQAARSAVQPVVVSYKQGETIVAGGDIITPAELEAMQQFGLIETEQPLETYLGAAAIVLAGAFFINLYYYRRPRIPFLTDARSLLIIAFIFLVFMISARQVVPNRTIVPYAFPLPAVGLLLATLFGMETGIVLSIVICVLASYGLSNTVILLPYYLVPTLCGIVVLGQARRFWAFLRAGFAIALSSIAMILAFRLPYGAIDWFGLAQLVGAALFSGLASASLALLLQYLLAQFLSLPTALQLLEISRPDFPLLQMFLRNAPGTYQHSLQVANLCEQAAEKIGADPLLSRVGATFHDIGKAAADPSFFIENQAPGSINTHSDLTPEKAASLIISHVTDGVKLAHKYRLPRRIDDFILEHHGTMLTSYQYNQALERAGGEAGKVDIEKFRYPGPRPRSRETGILMLADGVEARARAENPDSEEGLHNVVRAVVDRIEKERQLDNTQLTLHDLNLIIESFVTTLRGTYHARIHYPSTELPAAAPVETMPAPAPNKPGK